MKVERKRETFAAVACLVAMGVATAGCAGRDVRALRFDDVRYPYPAQFADLEAGRTAYVSEGPAEPAGTVLLIHGWAGDLRRWTRTIAFLARTHRVIALDLPGYGKSEKSATRQYSIPLFAEAARDLLRTLGVERATWIGHSLGGQIAAYAALELPEAVERIVLVDASGLAPAPERFAVFYSERRLRDPGYYALERMATHVVAEAPANLDEIVREGYALTLSDEYAVHARVRAQAHRSMAEHDLYYRMTRIRVPTLIVWGALDPIFSEYTAVEFNHRIPGSLLAVIPACGHLPPVEKPDQFNRVVGEFLGIRDLPALENHFDDRDPARSDDIWRWFY